MRLVFLELVAIAATVLLVVGTLRHACNPRRLHAGRHLAGGAR